MKNQKKFVVECDGSGNTGFAAVLFVDDQLADFLVEKISGHIRNMHNQESTYNIGFVAENYAVALGIDVIEKNVFSKRISSPAIISVYTDSEAVMKKLFSPHESKNELVEDIAKKIRHGIKILSKKGIDVEISKKQTSDTPHNFASEASKGVTSEELKQKIISEHLEALQSLGNPVFDIKRLIDPNHAKMTISESVFFDLVTSGLSYADAGKITGRDPETVRTTVLRAKKKSYA